MTYINIYNDFLFTRNLELVLNIRNLFRNARILKSSYISLEMVDLV
jgi:hypothetical protein